jgi:hypothetical protein
MPRPFFGFQSSLSVLVERMLERNEIHVFLMNELRNSNPTKISEMTIPVAAPISATLAQSDKPSFAMTSSP